MKASLLVLFLVATDAAAQSAQSAQPVPDAPIVVSGTVADEATRAALLERLRSVYGPARVVDQLSVGTVATPANWNDYVGRLINPNLKLVSRGQLKVEGNQVSLRGDVANEEQRAKIAGDIAASLNPTYVVNNGLRVTVSQQAVLDAALANRIIEFESGKATLTEAGMKVLDEMSAAMQKIRGVKVEVIGHTDNAGSRAGNLSLSQARAEAVKSYVVAKGIAAESVAVSGEGPDRPVADNRTAEGKARNRRIEFKVIQ
ncbi:OmpA family protein [Massilia sp. G4R7]|uniref:OmpA family protein n=1 Tax=Massilia phyllostachyos TaxID=2898585 RepID=A0ABS8Q3K6_9BURK|nr:OmpA family protein [Massilia phyllostachyos]MCD2516326.1 OmpA family protein [Massilia phyllostachyos]